MELPQALVWKGGGDSPQKDLCKWYLYSRFGETSHQSARCLETNGKSARCSLNGEETWICCESDYVNRLGAFYQTQQGVIENSVKDLKTHKDGCAQFLLGFTQQDFKQFSKWQVEDGLVCNFEHLLTLFKENELIKGLSAILNILMVVPFQLKKLTIIYPDGSTGSGISSTATQPDISECEGLLRAQSDKANLEALRNCFLKAHQHPEDMPARLAQKILRVIIDSERNDLIQSLPDILTYYIELVISEPKLRPLSSNLNCPKGEIVPFVPESNSQSKK